MVAQLLRPGDYDALLERYRTASTPQEEMRSLGALAGFPDVELCLRTFDLAMTEVRSQNGFSVISALLANPVGNQAVWERVTGELGRHPRSVPQERPAAHPRVPAGALRRRRVRRAGRSRSSTSTPWRRDRGGSPSRSSACGSTWPSRRASGRGWPTRLGAAGTPLLMAQALRRSDDQHDPARVQDLLQRARRTRGFMPDDEGEALFLAALRAGREEVPGAMPPTFVEIGAWCGKSSVYLGAAAEATGAVLLSIDHHRGSEENQPGWDYHEPDLVDPEAGRIDTLLHWRRTITGAALEASVVGIVGDSPTLAARWDRPLSFCFIDGGHGEEPAWADFRGWAPHVAVGGWLAIHDVFPDPADGGRPPYEIYRAALDSGEFVDDGACGSLRVAAAGGRGRAERAARCVSRA